MKREDIHEVLYQTLEAETRAIVVYATAIRLARNPDLRKEWEMYLDQANRHAAVLSAVLEVFGLEPGTETFGTKIIHQIGASLVHAMLRAEMARDPKVAELVAAECVALAESKNHLNWELIGEIAKKLEGVEGMALQAALEQVEKHQDQHLYPPMVWSRELWLDRLGLPALPRRLPEEYYLPTALGMARAS